MGKARRRQDPQTNGAILGSVSDDQGHAMYPTPALEVGEQFIQLYHTHGYFCDYLIFAFMLKNKTGTLVYCLSLQIFKTANLNFTNIKKLQIYLLFKKL